MNVLLIGDNEQRCKPLTHRLERNGCQLRFASSVQDVQLQIYQNPPHLVLSTRPVTQGSALMEVLSGFATNVFYSFPIEDSCLWLQAIRNGQACLKPAVMRSGEFIQELEQMLKGNGLEAA